MLLHLSAVGGTALGECLQLSGMGEGGVPAGGLTADMKLWTCWLKPRSACWWQIHWGMSAAL